MNILLLLAPAAAATSSDCFVGSEEVCLLQLTRKGGDTWEGSSGKQSTQVLQDTATSLSVCGRSAKAGSIYCRTRGEEEATISEDYKQIDGVHVIADSQAYKCYDFLKKDDVSARKFRDPVFPTGRGWPHLYRGKIEIPDFENARVYVISLPDAEKRRHHFAHQWASLDLKMPAVWVEGVNGQDPFSASPFRREYLQQKSPEDQQTHKGIAACWESHAGILSAAAGGHVVILEDDVAFIANFTARFKEFIGSLPSGWDMLRIGGDTFWDPPFAEKPHSWMKTRSASRTWGYVVRDRAVPKLMHANQVTLDLRAVDTFYGGLSFACDDAYAMNTFAPPQPFVLGTGGVSVTDQLHPHTNLVVKTLLATEEFEDKKSDQYSWYPSTCCSLPNVDVASFKSWCCRENNQRHDLDYCQT